MRRIFLLGRWSRHTFPLFLSLSITNNLDHNIKQAWAGSEGRLPQGPLDSGMTYGEVPCASQATGAARRPQQKPSVSWKGQDRSSPKTESFQTGTSAPATPHTVPARQPSQTSRHPPVPRQRPLHRPASTGTSAGTGQQHPDSYYVTLTTPSLQSVSMHRKRQEDSKCMQGDWRELLQSSDKRAIASKQHRGHECREQEPRQRNYNLQARNRSWKEPSRNVRGNDLSNTAS